MREIIIKNVAECLVCHELVESTHVHDYRSCKCGAIAVDGGREYLRRSAKSFDLLVERSIVEHHPVSQWLTRNVVNAVIEREDLDSIQSIVRKVLDRGFAFQAPHDIMDALRELPFVKAMPYEDLKAIETTIRKELTGKEQ